MTDVNSAFDEEELCEDVPTKEVISARQSLEDRCKAAGITLKEVTIPNEELLLRVGMKCGRDTRWLGLWNDESLIQLLSIEFERYVYLSNLEAICSYVDGTIEAAVRPLVQLVPTSVTYRRLFGLDGPNDPVDAEAMKVTIPPNQDGQPYIEFSRPSEVFMRLSKSPVRSRMTLKLSGCHVTTHESALALLNKVAGAVLFQLDLLTDVPMALERERRRLGARRPKKPASPVTELQYPKTQFDSAPLSLYWYARSAEAMPLLQFLAYYQVIEFYFPIYSQSEAQRKLKAILKDPTFRGDRDADIARLLSAIHISRSGAFGDERSQLRATLIECVDSDALRIFLEENVERKEFFSAKSKTSPYHKVPLASPSIDLRNDVADRIYDIRCKIVHTKSDARDGNVELLLPFSPEAEQLSIDIELVQYISQLVLVAGSAPFNVHG